MFALLPTPPDLAPWVRCIWTLRTDASTHPEPPIAPDGCCEWILHVGTPPLMAVEGGWTRQSHEFLFGQLTGPLHLHGDGAMALIAVRFHPHAATALLRVSGPALCPQPMDPARLAPGLRRGQRIDAHAGIGDAYRAILARLRFLAARARDPDPLVADVLQRLDRSDGARLTPLPRELGFSLRTLERRFLAATGLGMKTYARIQRMQQTLHALSRPEAALAVVAQELGFSDQAHLTRELAALAGRRPQCAPPLRLS